MPSICFAILSALFGRLGQLDAAALAAAARMNLGLDNHDTPAEPLGDCAAPALDVTSPRGRDPKPARIDLA